MKEVQEGNWAKASLKFGSCQSLKLALMAGERHLRLRKLRLLSVESFHRLGTLWLISYQFFLVILEMFVILQIGMFVVGLGMNEVDSSEIPGGSWLWTQFVTSVIDPWGVHMLVFPSEWRMLGSLGSNRIYSWQGRIGIGAVSFQLERNVQDQEPKNNERPATGS